MIGVIRLKLAPVPSGELFILSRCPTHHGESIKLPTPPWSKKWLVTCLPASAVFFNTTPVILVPFAIFPA